ncbi:PilZ domain-containing protein [Acanthopleuribacter pedis]|nr:PilZ domain-containing protein [Acanthopleuribacter pedis]
MDELHAGERRRFFRYSMGSTMQKDLEVRTVEVVAHIDINTEDENFEPEYIGMVVEQSHQGCGLVLVRYSEDYEKIDKGQEVVVKVGRLHPMKAKVRWRKNLDEDLFKLGLEFLE